MRVIDFIQQKSDCLNETDFFKTLNALTDAYSSALVKRGVRAGDLSEKSLLANFLVQEIIQTPRGYAFLRDPGKNAPIRRLH